MYLKGVTGWAEGYLFILFIYFILFYFILFYFILFIYFILFYLFIFRGIEIQKLPWEN